MANTIKPLYASTATAITFTSLVALASSATAGTGAESSSIDNSSTLYTRIRLHGRFCIGNGTPGSDKAIYVFLYPIIPNTGGTNTPIGYNRIPQGTDQALPLSTPDPTATFPETMPGVQLVAVVPVTTAGTLLEWTALVKDVPYKWALFVRNYCACPLSGASATWQSSYSYVLGAIVTPTSPNGHYYLCIVAGTSDSEPVWPTVSAGNTIVDNTVTWLDIGTDAPNTVFFQGENDQIV